jgi:hypothetical protein
MAVLPHDNPGGTTTAQVMALFVLLRTDGAFFYAKQH